MASLFTRQNYGWVVIGGVLVFQGVTLGFMGFCFTLWVEPWIEEFGAPRIRIMLISTVMMLAMGGFSALVGRFLDRFPPNLIVTFGLLVFAAGLWFTANATAFMQVFVLYAIVLPFATALTGTLASQSLAVRWFGQHKHMGLAIGIAAMGVSLGGAIIPPLVGDGLIQHDWRWVFRQAALVIGLGIAPLLFVVLTPRPAQRQPETENAGTENKSADTATDSKRSIPFTTLIRNRYFYIPASAFFLDSIAYLGYQYNAASYLKTVGIGLAEAAELISMMAMVMLAAKLIVGKLTDYLHYRYVFVGAAAFNCIALLIFSLQVNAFIPLATVCIGLGAGGLIPLQAKIISTHFPDHFGGVFGYFVFFSTCAMIGAFLLSLLRDVFDSYQQPLLIFLAIVAFAMTLMWRLKPVPAAEAEIRAAA